MPATLPSRYEHHFSTDALGSVFSSALTTSWAIDCANGEVESAANATDLNRFQQKFGEMRAWPNLCNTRLQNGRVDS